MPNYTGAAIFVDMTIRDRQLGPFIVDLIEVHLKGIGGLKTLLQPFFQQRKLVESSLAGCCSSRRDLRASAVSEARQTPFSGSTSATSAIRKITRIKILTTYNFFVFLRRLSFIV